MQQPTGGRPRTDAAGTTRDKAPAKSPLRRLTGRVMRATGRDRKRTRAASVGTTLGATLRPLTSAERALPIAVAAIVAVAALLAFLPITPQGTVAGIQGATAAPRLAVNGGISHDDALATALGALNAANAAAGIDGNTAARTEDPSFGQVVLPETEVADPSPAPTGTAEPPAAVIAQSAAPTATPVANNPLAVDGTIVVGPAPATRVEDGSDLIRSYTVQKGDSLRSIAKKFGISSQTLWWANQKQKVKAATGQIQVKPGQVLRVPPVSGVVYTVKATDTLDTVASHFKVDSSKIVELNGLDDPTLVVGQVLVLPGAKGPPLPTPKPTQKPSSGAKTTTRSGGGVSWGGPSSYPGGKMRWPVIGGGNYISQYFHYGHYAIDIAADYGAKVVASAPGKVIFAGWKSNGGGYQVWISHGSNIYTTYNHMSAVTVSRGESVSRGEQVGRVGASGLATGPHCHFEVWNGRIWDGGTRVNPLKYF